MTGRADGIEKSGMAKRHQAVCKSAYVCASRQMGELTDRNDVAEGAEGAQVPLATDDLLTFRKEQRASDRPYVAEG